jgi:hypothetical protein
MGCDSENCEHGWHYDPVDTLAGQLQRGLGRGAVRALRAPDAADLVLGCLRRDHRWDSQVDERCVYLARLVQDLQIPVTALLERLYVAAPDEFTLTLGVLEKLALAGSGTAVEGLRRYVGDGDHWLDALSAMADSWPRAWWDDLHDTAGNRLRGIADRDVLWREPPWTHWAEHDDRIARRLPGHGTKPTAPRPFADTDNNSLLTLLCTTDRSCDHRAAIRELNRRPPEPSLLQVVDQLPVIQLGGPIGTAIRRLGPLALPTARRWAQTGHPLIWTAYQILADHGDQGDVPALLAGIDWLDAREDDLCGYDDLANGLARIGGPGAGSAVPRLRQLLAGPHSYERASYHRALLTLDPTGTVRHLAEGLWDCESEVRLLAARHGPLNPHTRTRLRHLCDDPLERADVRAAAAARLTNRLPAPGDKDPAPE